jgi:hypothetical protein
MEKQPELPLEFPESQGTSRYGAPVPELAEGAKNWAAKFGRIHNTDQFANIRAGESHSALYPVVRRAIGEPMTPKMQESYSALRAELPEQYKYLTSPREQGGMGISVEVTNENPYEHPREMAEDVQKNRRLRVLSTESTGGHSVFSNEENDMFRAVHDAFGHLSIARDFSKHGEEAAYSSHAQMFSKKALPALVSETRAQNAYVENAGDFPPNAPINVPDWATEVGKMPPEPKQKRTPKVNQLQFKFD